MLPDRTTHRACTGDLLIQRSPAPETFLALLKCGQYRGNKSAAIDRMEACRLSRNRAQVAELVDALVSGTSGESRGGSSPLLGTKYLSTGVLSHPKMIIKSVGLDL